MPKWVYNFGAGEAEGHAELQGKQEELLANKGANLAEMASIGLPVPPGFTLTIEVCSHFVDSGSYPEGLKEQVQKSLQTLESRAGCKFGDSENPLLVAVRAGGRASMPGMMDTVLNVGLNAKTVEALAEKSGDERFAYDSYRRFIQMYADVVLGIDSSHFEKMLRRAKQKRGVNEDHELRVEDLERLVRDYKTKVFVELGAEFPTDPQVQLWGAIGAVFKSCSSSRAKTYRELHDISEDGGSAAATVQAMVFGNGSGPDSASGVAFTRNPSSGDNHFYGEFLLNAQGEDLVGGIRTPAELTMQARLAHGNSLPSLEEKMPKIFRELVAVREQLEKHYKDVQDIEFTIQKGKLYMLQTRAGKRTTHAAIQIAVDMTNEGLITKPQAVMRLHPSQIDQLLHPTIREDAKRQVIAKGLPASPGAAMGKVVFCADEAVQRVNDGEKVILVRSKTSADDIHGLHAAEGVLTTCGGMTSHAAVVARSMGRPCVAGAGHLEIDEAAGKLKVGDVVVEKGQKLTIDGSTGEVLLGDVPTVVPKVTGAFRTLMSWSDEYRTMQVRANAETVADARLAKDFGAEGIGLVRTEHMFFVGMRITAMRQMILASDTRDRKDALHRLLFMQREDMTELFQIMEGQPVMIRLFDPPLHEFLPNTEAELSYVARAAGVPVDRVRRRATELNEANPMLGHRGCRLAITYPEICEMQARAIFGAAVEAGRTAPSKKFPVAEIMVPLVASVGEFKIIKQIIDKTAAAIQKEENVNFEYRVGSMIELPRAALQAAKLAEHAEFFSFGTNDLTQTTYGLSRDDTGSFMADYKAKGIMACDPFVTLDEDGVGELIKLAMTRGHSTRPDMKMGICGEHGGDPTSIDFCQRIGFNYVSCSPYRVPIARLAAAQSALKARGEQVTETRAAKPRVPTFGPW